MNPFAELPARARLALTDLAHRVTRQERRRTVVPLLLFDEAGAAQAVADTLGTMASQDANSVAITGGSITGMPSPSSASDVATKAYVDAFAAGIKPKAPVVAATTGPGTLATDFENGDAVDGVTLATGDRLLVKDQADAKENGIYVVAASGAPARSTDADTGAELVGAYVFVEGGTANALRAYVCSDPSITIGVDDIHFVEFIDVSGALLASNNLSDLASAAAARGNLGLGSSATHPSGDFGPSNVDYLVKTADPTLTAERVVTDTPSIVVDWATVGQAKFSVVFGTSGTTACVGNDSRLSDPRAPTGSAGGDLTGSYPNPTIAALAVTDAKINDVALAKVIGAGTMAAQDADNVDISGGRITMLHWKEPVWAATTTPGVLATDFDNGSSIDGVTIHTNDRILIKDQTALEENGIYVVNASGAPTRAPDADSADDLLKAVVAVVKGTTNINNVFICRETAITLGSSSIRFIPLSQALGLEIGVDVQAYSAQLASAAVVGSGLVARTAANTFTPRTITVGPGLLVTNGDGVGGDPQVTLDTQTGWSTGTHSTKRSLATGDSLADTQDYLLTLVADLIAGRQPRA